MGVQLQDLMDALVAITSIKDIKLAQVALAEVDTMIQDQHIVVNVITHGIKILKLY